MGFDPLTFIPLEDSIFKQRIYIRSSGKLLFTSDYRRHHLDINKKRSVFFQDLALTDIRTHNYWNQLSEEESKELLRRFSLLVNKRGEVTKVDIIKTFEGLDWVLYNEKTGWFNYKTFNYNIAKFNQRKNVLNNLDLEGFIEKNKMEYNELYNRFFKNIVEDKLKRIILYIKPPNLGFRDHTDHFIIEQYFKIEAKLKKKCNNKFPES